ncbi:MAG: hypothetical protein P1V20_02095 [Verrucomicrobiales bacterium]|nr:hypothetical protein [Verrucomicrobiales bacterium]
MKLKNPFRDLKQVELDAPPTASCGLFRILFVVYLASFVFDYKSVDLGFGAASTGGSPLQYGFLLLAILSGGIGSILGLRHLLTKPGVYLIILWWSYVLFAVVVAVLSGNEVGRILRLLIPSLLVGLGMNLTLICACVGMRPGEAVRWFLLAGVTNVVWKFIYGGFLSGIPLSEVRMGILSPAMRFLFAWSACALLLRHRFTPWVFLVFGLPLATAVLSITRSMAFPIVVSFISAACCLGLAMWWKMYDLKHAFRKISVLAVFGFAALGIVLIAIISLPNVADRWSQRIFDNKGAGGATTEDLSTLMRKAEAKSMWDILSKDPETFVYGKGLGAGYYWDEDYYPELFLVYPKDRHQFPHNIYSAGHSIWTYTLFSRGMIGVVVTLSVFFISMYLSLKSAHMNSKTVMGPRAWDSFLIFLPFVGMWAMLSESITRNPFDERFTGVLFGVLLVFPQFYFNRAWFLKHREKIGQEAPQIILDEDLVPEDLADDLRSFSPPASIQGDRYSGVSTPQPFGN